MARPARKAKSTAASKLAEALNFVAPASNDDPSRVYQAHARVAAKWIIATNGTVSAGHPVEEELALCPHIARLVDALNKAGTTLALTERENGQLLVAGDKLKATVPCIPGDQFPPIMPDPQCAVIDDRIKEGFGTVVGLAAQTGERVFETSILLRANSMFGCNGNVIFEYWHGIDLPPGLVIPKPAALAIANAKKTLSGFGFSRASATFYFEDGSWYKTQLYGETWPDIDALFDAPCFPGEVPAGLFEAVAAIENFSKDGAVHFHDEKMKTTYDNYEVNGPTYGATYEVPGLQGKHSFSAKLLRLIQPVCQSIDYTSADDRAFFMGGNVRGVIMKRSKPEPPPPPREALGSPPAAPSDGWGAIPAADPNASAWAAVTGDDVPF
jgi:hypothetical protein